jgi:signal transduction histidine kinase
VVVLLREEYSKEALQKRYMADMLSDISHQIKTPISAITIMADLLEEAELSDEKRLDYADKIDKQAKRITWLIRNLLVLAQLEADVLEWKKESVRVNDIFREIQDSLEIMAELKGVHLICEAEKRICIYCDRHWMMEALLNIIKNCVEHTGEGGTVKVQAAQDNIAVHIHIMDDGEGIDEEELPHIFERFYKGEHAQTGSVGIGLAMAKQIILKQNGVVAAASEKGVGTEFYVKLFRTETV